MNPRSRNAGFTLSKKELHSIYNSRTRVLKPYEVFAKLYPDEVEKRKREECERKGVKGRQQLSVWQEVAKDLYEAASEEKKEAVRKQLHDDVDSEGEESGTSPKSYMRLVSS